MVAKSNGHRYGTKLRHCQPMYREMPHLGSACRRALSLVPRLSTWRCPRPQLQRLQQISIAGTRRCSCRSISATRAQAAASGRCRPKGQTDARTDGRTDTDRCTDPVPYSMQAASITCNILYTKGDVGLTVSLSVYSRLTNSIVRRRNSLPWAKSSDF